MVGFDVEVGIDAEFIAPDFDIDGFAEANYHPDEFELFKNKNDDEQAEFFYKIWTMKEAFLKLTGEGINDHLKDINFSGNEDQLKYPVYKEDELWQYSWRRKDNYMCSLACNKQPDIIRLFDSSLIEPVVNEDY